MHPKILFKGQEYILVGGAITTPEDLKNFRVSFAHLGEDGLVRRYHEVIGSEKDIEYIGEDNTHVENLSGIHNNNWFQAPKTVEDTPHE